MTQIYIPKIFSFILDSASFLITALCVFLLIRAYQMTGEVLALVGCGVSFLIMSFFAWALTGWFCEVGDE